MERAPIGTEQSAHATEIIIGDGSVWRFPFLFTDRNINDRRHHRSNGCDFALDDGPHKGKRVRGK